MVVPAAEGSNGPSMHHGGELIVRGHLLCDEAGPPPPPPGWVRIAGERIVEVGRGAPPPGPALGDDRSLICPGFIDAHVHLPQIEAAGHDGMELLEWLERVIFPLEARWAAQAAADAACLQAYSRLLGAGTLGFAGWLSPSPAGVVAAVRAAHRLPLRAIAGQVLMDRGGPPELLGQPEARLNRSERGRFEASVNPRFAPACSEALLARAARRARAGDAFVQTHLAESIAECRRVAELFPGEHSYTALYDRLGLLHQRTLLAHGVHLSADEWALIAARGSVMVHCPTANTFLGSGLFDLGAAREHGVRLALGSDLAAGPDLAMPRVARGMIEVAKARAMAGLPACIPTPAEAWRQITRGNADALGWPDAGRIEPGAAADLLLLQTGFDPDDPDLPGRLIYTWSEQYVRVRIVAGRVV